MSAVADEEVEDEADYKVKVLKVIQDIDMKVNKLGILSNDIQEQNWW